MYSKNKIEMFKTLLQHLIVFALEQEKVIDIFSPNLIWEHWDYFLISFLSDIRAPDN